MLSLLYRILYFIVLVATCSYAVGFLGNLIVPKSIDSGVQGSVTRSLSIDLALLALLAIQQSITRRTWFRRCSTRLVPGPIEHSTYALFTCIVLLILFRQWRPVPLVIWNIESAIGQSLVWLLFGLGWLLAIFGLLLTNHSGRLWLQKAGVTVAMWTTPRMTLGHVLFAGVTTVWLLIAIRSETSETKRTNDDFSAQPLCPL